MNPLLDAARSLAEESDPARRLDRLLALIVGLSGAERGFIALLENGALKVKAAWTDGGADTRTASDTLLARALRDGRPVVMADALEDVELASARSVQRRRVRSVCALPLRAGGEPVGVVALDHRTPGAFDPALVATLEAIASMAAASAGPARRPAPAAAPGIPADPFSRLAGRSEAMNRLRGQLSRVAPLPWPVCLLGETGTGKEVAARAIHDAGPRASGPFIAANCAAIPEAIAEGEVFGHVRGAFTGADRDRPGLFELAHGGTLLLDEAEAMPASIQELLLRVVQDGVVRRVGARETTRVDVRIIAASNEDLSALAAAGRFRPDLWYRLGVLRVQLPPLRERPGDLQDIAGRLLDRISRETGQAPRRLSAGAWTRLQVEAWPGNVRQLDNVLRQAVAFSDRDPLEPGDLDSALAPAASGAAPEILSIEDYIRRCLERFEGILGVTGVADRLGISRKTIWRKRRSWAARTPR